MIIYSELLHAIIRTKRDKKISIFFPYVYTMATCSMAGCPCKNLYTDWDIGHRGGNCEDCGHLKTNHLREALDTPCFLRYSSTNEKSDSQKDNASHQNREPIQDSH